MLSVTSGVLFLLGLSSVFFSVTSSPIRSPYAGAYVYQPYQMMRMVEVPETTPATTLPSNSTDVDAAETVTLAPQTTPAFFDLDNNAGAAIFLVSLLSGMFSPQ